MVLSGAGLSTESGIPDYRGPSGASRRHAPMTFQTFVRDARGRHRYWARGYLGWQHFGGVLPNDGHRAVADLERAGLVSGIITQNVDGLHHQAGSIAVIDLHGRMSRVVCLDCGVVVDRGRVQDRLVDVNREWTGSAGAVNPDGDVDLPDAELDGFVMVACEACGGVLKPDVVYFGENVPAERVTEAYGLVDAATSLLVLGTSLTVFSGRRFVVRAAQQQIPVAIVNAGPTRGDDLATVRVDAPLGQTLASLVNRLGVRPQE